MANAGGVGGEVVELEKVSLRTWKVQICRAPYVKSEVVSIDVAVTDDFLLMSC